MEHETTTRHHGDETHFWIDCPGCAFQGKIGLPLDYPAEVVVCPSCRQVVRVRPEDRVLWQPGDAADFLRQRFPDAVWEPADQRDGRASESNADSKSAGSSRGQATSDGTPATAVDRAEPSDEDGDRYVGAGRRRAAGHGRVAPSAPRPSLTRRTVAELLDKEPVQFALIIVATILPLALAMFVPRAIDRARVGNRELTEPAREAALNAASKTPAARAAAAADVNPPATAPEPPTPDVLYRRGKQRRAKGDYPAAICDFDDVLRAKPEFVWCYYDRAGAYTLMGNQQAALADLDRALLALPDEPKVWHARAVVYHRMRNLRAAVADICRAVELVEGDARGGDRAFARQLKRKRDKLTDELFEHATALVRCGRCEAAIEELTQVVKQRPSDASAWLRRGLAYDLSGQYAAALDDLNVALSLRPGPPEAFKLRSTLHERNEDYAAALADMRAAQRLGPSRGEYAERIRWLAAQRRVQERTRQLAVRWRGR